MIWAWERLALPADACKSARVEVRAASYNWPEERMPVKGWITACQDLSQFDSDISRCLARIFHRPRSAWKMPRLSDRKLRSWISSIAPAARMKLVMEVLSKGNSEKVRYWSPNFLKLVASNRTVAGVRRAPDRKSTRLNSSHPSSSYAVFCL